LPLAQQLEQLHDEGFCIVQDALDERELEDVRAALDRAVTASEQAGIPVHDSRLDPNAANIRVYNLPKHDPVFLDLMRRPDAREVVEGVLGPHFLVSNFTANIALPGSGSMNLHSDQALAVPAPWDATWAFNIIWCLDDVHAANGATRYLPGSHRYRAFEDVPTDAAGRLRPFEAPAGSFIAMSGKLWHTSGANTTAAERRRMLFGYYSCDFIRPQMNWEAVLAPEAKAALDEDARRLLGLGPQANTRIGGALTRLQQA
jgi:ectoine hydroxylase-related dioxygenase (phytanoyl-CoA dioxygenase family)